MSDLTKYKCNRCGTFGYSSNFDPPLGWIKEWPGFYCQACAQVIIAEKENKKRAKAAEKQARKAYERAAGGGKAKKRGNGLLIFLVLVAVFLFIALR